MQFLDNKGMFPRLCLLPDSVTLHCLWVKVQPASNCRVCEVDMFDLPKFLSDGWRLTTLSVHVTLIWNIWMSWASKKKIRNMENSSKIIVERKTRNIRGRRLAQLVEQVSPVQRLCPRCSCPGSSPGLMPFAACNSPSLSSCFLSSLQLNCLQSPPPKKKWTIMSISQWIWPIKWQPGILRLKCFKANFCTDDEPKDVTFWGEFYIKMFKNDHCHIFLLSCVVTFCIHAVYCKDLALFE